MLQKMHEAAANVDDLLHHGCTHSYGPGIWICSVGSYLGLRTALRDAPSSLRCAVSSASATRVSSSPHPRVLSPGPAGHRRNATQKRFRNSPPQPVCARTTPSRRCWSYGPGWTSLRSMRAAARCCTAQPRHYFYDP
jgi:hypothetical protein